MFNTQSSSPLIFLRVSALSQIEFCPKKSKIMCFTNPKMLDISDKKHSNVLVTGTRLHKEYSRPFKSFDRMYLNYKLGEQLYKNNDIAFQKRIDNIVIRGMFDDLKVVLYNGKKYVSLIEIKTTTKKYMWSREVKAAIRQLQLYMWLMKERFEELNYPLWKRSYLEMYSQKSKRLIRRIAVEYDDNIEQWIRDSVDIFKGLKRMNIPSFSYCKLCSQQIKIRCNWYTLRKEYEKNENRRRIF